MLYQQHFKISCTKIVTANQRTVFYYLSPDWLNSKKTKEKPIINSSNPVIYINFLSKYIEPDYKLMGKIKYS